jgi:trimeric autotransporter adhesin
MNSFSAHFVAAVRPVLRHWAEAPLAAAAILVLTACTGTAVVTLTATASTDTFLAYRVGLVSVELETSNGNTATKVLPASTTVDLVNLINLSEVLGSTAVAAANYTTAIVTVDYSSAEIVYDDGTEHGLALIPVGASGQALGQVTLTLTLDPANNLTISANKVSRLALDFKLAASNVVNTSAGMVMVTPLIAASASPTDSKNVRIRGPLLSTDTANTRYTLGVTPFDFPVGETGQLTISPTDVTTYEINGTAWTGAAGLTALAGMNSNVMTVTLGTMTSSSSTSTTTTNGTTTTSTTTDVSYAATEVLAGSSVQSSSLDRVSGIVSARSGNTLTVEDATLIGIDGSNTFMAGTATVKVGGGTLVTVLGQGAAGNNTIAQISLGSLIYAFGTAAAPSSGNVTLDASAGHVQLDQTSASGFVTVVGSGSLDLDLTSLGGRSIKAFDFVGSGSSSSAPASASSYVVSTGALDLTNSTVGVPVVVTGLVASFGAAPPDFTASALLDPSTISAELVADYGSGTATPFTAYNGSELDLTRSNASIGTRHWIQVGAESIDIAGMSSDPLIVPSSTVPTLVFSIGHMASGTVENFITYAAFNNSLTNELNGSVLVTNVTALGQYTSSSYTFTASSVTVVLNN